MKEYIKEIAELILYKGPSIGEVLDKIIGTDSTFVLEDKNDCIYLTVKSKLPYFTLIEDKYIFNKLGNLLKQSIIINNGEKIIFDKYEEIISIANDLNINNYQIA